MKIAIVGIQGLPNQYGGFETLAEYLVKYLGCRHEFTVYCSAKDQKDKPLEYQGARLKYYNITSHGGKGVLFDSISLVDALCGLWLCYAIGTEGSVLNNKVTHYLSNISMEIYLCHMMAFRGVQMLHLSEYIQQPDMLYWLTCLLTIGVAIVFSHVVKYKVLPVVDPYLFKQSK